MYLYLIRHGIAIDPDPLVADPIASDESRSLTRVGRKKIEQVADRMIKLELRFDLIMTSPLVRAKQTADLLINQQMGDRLEVSDDLKPIGNLQSWLTNWHKRSDHADISTLALVGHEPNLTEWAELLMLGQVYHQLILKKGGLIGLKFGDDQIKVGSAQLACLISPKYLI
jgi:phosphohistidine phosphatase